MKTATKNNTLNTLIENAREEGETISSIAELEGATLVTFTKVEQIIELVSLDGLLTPTPVEGENFTIHILREVVITDAEVDEADRKAKDQVQGAWTRYQIADRRCANLVSQIRSLKEKLSEAQEDTDDALGQAIEAGGRMSDPDNDFPDLFGGLSLEEIKPISKK